MAIVLGKRLSWRVEGGSSNVLPAAVNLELVICGRVWSQHRIYMGHPLCQGHFALCLIFVFLISSQSSDLC
jgi:hypothetical protein